MPWLSSLLWGVLLASAVGAAPLEVRSVRASETSAHVNSHLILGQRDALLVDVAMTRADAAAVAQAVQASGRRLRFVFITNSQPDKYLGLPVLLEAFPDARVVTTPEVAAEIGQRAPAYRDRLEARWGKRIVKQLRLPEPFAESALELEGERIEIHRFRGGECPNAAALYVPSLRAFFAGAIVFEGSHLFLREKDIAGWREHLAWIRAHGAIDRIYPGHGETTDLGVLDAMERYLDDFEQAIALGGREAAVAFMRSRYPEYRLERLLREYSVPAFLPDP